MEKYIDCNGLIHLTFFEFYLGFYFGQVDGPVI